MDTGEGQGWKIVKFHMLKHIIHHIIMFGWIENSSCQAGEHLHKFYLKLIRRLTNNKQDWEKQVFHIHARDQALHHMIAEVGMSQPTLSICNQQALYTHTTSTTCLMIT